MKMIQRVLIATALFCVLIGGLFVAHFYRVFFAPNTSFEIASKEILIPSENTKAAAYDTLSSRLERLHIGALKSGMIT